MAFPTAVNSQITDSITQANVKVIAESPAMAMGSLYQSLAHSTGILFENAVAAQQQQNTLAQAAANMGVMQIYSLDTTAAAGATEKIAQTGITDNLTSLLTVLNAFGMQATPKAMAVAPAATADIATAATAEVAVVAPAAAIDPASDDAGTADIAQQIRDAVIFVNQTVLGSNDDFMAGLQAAVAAMAHALETAERNAHAARVHVLQEAALAATLAAMLREPEKAKEYETVLQVVQRMG
jgi:hypothetical protein